MSINWDEFYKECDCVDNKCNCIKDEESGNTVISGKGSVVIIGNNNHVNTVKINDDDFKYESFSSVTKLGEWEHAGPEDPHWLTHEESDAI